MESYSVNRQGASKGDRGLRTLWGRGASPKETSETAMEYSFLKHMFEPIHSFTLANDSHSLKAREHDGRLKLELSDSIRIDAETNIKHLKETATRYAEICDKALDYRATGNSMADIASLLDAVQRIAPPEHSISVDYDATINELVFVEYAPVDYEDCMIFTLPIGFVDMLPPYQREMCCRFLHHLIIREGFALPEDHWDMSYALGYWDDDVFIDTPDSYRKMADRYRNGDIHNLMQAIMTSKGMSFKEQQVLNNLRRSTSGHLSDVYGLMSEYLKTLNDKCCRWYDRTPDSSELGYYDNEQCDYITSDRLYFVVYSCGVDDPVADMATTMCCEEASNLGQRDLYQHRVLSGRTEGLMPREDYPQRWAEWFGKFVRAIMDYEQDNRNSELQIRAENGRDCIQEQPIVRAVS